LDSLIRRMMAVDPAARPQTPAELFAELAAVTRSAPASSGGSGLHLALPAGASPPAPPVPHTAAMVRAHEGGMHALAVAPDGSFVLTGGLDGGKPRPTCRLGHTGPVTAVAFATSADSLLSAGQDGTGRQWDLATVRLKGTLGGTVGPIAGLAFGVKRVAVAGKTLAVRQQG